MQCVCRGQGSGGTGRTYLHDEAEVCGQGLDSVEAGDQRDGQVALGVHLPAQEEVALQVVEAEVVLTDPPGNRTKKPSGAETEHVDTHTEAQPLPCVISHANLIKSYSWPLDKHHNVQYCG